MYSLVMSLFLCNLLIILHRIVVVEAINYWLPAQAIMINGAETVHT